VASQRYLRDFSIIAKKGGTVGDLVHGMLELHGEPDQPTPCGSRLEPLDGHEPQRTADGQSVGGMSDHLPGANELTFATADR
jgi:hypothetical protein